MSSFSGYITGAFFHRTDGFIFAIDRRQPRVIDCDQAFMLTGRFTKEFLVAYFSATVVDESLIILNLALDAGKRCTNRPIEPNDKLFISDIKY